MNKLNYTIAIIFWGICFLTPLSSQTPTASFATWKDNKKAAYSIIHDDYSDYVTGIFQYADPIATARGIKLCFGAITSACGPLEWANAKTMMSHGHECINHSHNHLCGGTAGQCSGLSTYGSANFATELDFSTQLIEINTGVRPRFFIHPYDAPSDAILNHLKNNLGYLGSRAGTQLAVNANTFTDFMRLNFYVYDGTAAALTSLNTAVNSAISSGGYAVREFHGIDDGSWSAMTAANYTSHLDYVKTKMNDGSIWSATPTEAITYKMQRDAFQPVVAYTASTGIINVTFNTLKTIDPSVLRTPVTVNVNLNGIAGSYTVLQNNANVVSTRVGSIISFNVYPNQGAVTLKCTDCAPPPPLNILNLTATPQTNAALLNWTNPASNFDEVLIVAKPTSGFTTIPVGTTYASDADFTGAGTAFEGGKVVYRGLGTSLTVTNLTGGINYYFRAYTRLGTVWSSGVQVNAVPNILVIPQPDNIINLIATAQTTAALLNWSNPIANFDEVMIVAKPLVGFSTIPNGTSYTADANFTGGGTAFEAGKVIYRGIGTSVTVTNLVGGTPHYLRAYTRLGNVWSSGIEVNVVPNSVVIPQPLSIFNLTATPQTNAVTLSWTNPASNFEEVMIVAKPISGFATIPSGTIYTADANFIGGGTAFEGGKVVYRGASTNVTVTNLADRTNYYFRAYTRLGNIWSSGVEVNAIPNSVVIPQPLSIFNLTATPQTNAAALSWTNPASNFEEVMIVAKPISGFTTIPTGITYTADANFTGAGTAFEGGKVIYKGAGTNVTATNLVGGTTHYFRAYTRLGSIWSSGVEVNVIPAVLVIPQPLSIFNLTATPQTNAAALNWTNPASNFEEVMIVAKPISGFTTIPTGITYTADANFTGAGTAFEGGKVIYKGAGTNVTATNLVGGTTHYFRAYTRLGSIWSSGVEVNVIPNSIVIPPVCGPDGKMVREYWNNITYLVSPSITYLTIDSRYPNNPTSRDTLTEFRSSNKGDRYGERARGYIVPKESGVFTFYVTGDDNVDFYLSSTDNASNKRRICRINGLTGETEFNKYSSQKSVAINLIAGQYYYFELQHVQGISTNHFGVHWQTPSNSIITIIDKAFFSSKTCSAIALQAATPQYFAFDGRLDGDKAVLNWVTKSVKETDYFILEKADEKTGEFKQLDIINSLDKNQSLQAFTYADLNLIGGDNFYRLKTVFQNGATVKGNSLEQYSEIVRVRYDRPNLYDVFPNPTTDYFSIDLSPANGKAVDIKIITLLGKVVKQELIDTPSVFHRFELGDMPSGQYFIHIQPQGKRLIVKKLVVVK